MWPEIKTGGHRQATDGATRPRVRDFDPDVVKTGLVLYHRTTSLELTVSTTNNDHKATTDLTEPLTISISFSAFRTGNN